jgi:ribonucleotide reductase beta subunit family protein with ferritin-like domain
MSQTDVQVTTDEVSRGLSVISTERALDAPDAPTDSLTLESVADVTDLNELIDEAIVASDKVKDEVIQVEATARDENANDKENEDDSESEGSVDSTESMVSIDDDSEDVEDEEGDDSNHSGVISDEQVTDAEFIQAQAHSKTYSTLLSNFDIEAERAMDADEELLDPSNDRLVLKPINPKFKVIWELYKKQAEAFWTPEKIDFSRDKYDFRKLKRNIQSFIKKVLAFFAGADSIVNVNIQKQFSKIAVKEANVAYAFQEMMENIHSEVYSDMLDNIITNPKEKNELINAFKTVESIKDMIGWGQAWIESERRIGFSIMAFTIFEGLMFSSAFAAIYWLKHQLPDDKMQGLIGSNEFIARDEGMHTNFGCLMYDYVIHRLTPKEAQIMMTEGVDIAKRFIKDALPIRLIGMSEGLMGEYLEYVADRLMVYLGYEKIYSTKMPEAFSFMEQIGVLNKNNFFERRTSEYQMAHNKDNTADWQFRILDKY